MRHSIDFISCSSGSQSERNERASMQQNSRRLFSYGKYWRKLTISKSRAQCRERDDRNQAAGETAQLSRAETRVAAITHFTRIYYSPELCCYLALGKHNSLLMKFHTPHCTLRTQRKVTGSDASASNSCCAKRIKWSKEKQKRRMTVL